MPSELQRVVLALLAALDEAPRVVDYLLRTAHKFRENASYVGDSSHPAAKMAAMQLDEAARRCDEGAHYLAQAPPRARGWAEQMVGGGHTQQPTRGSTSQRPEGMAGRTPPTKPGRHEDSTKPDPPTPGNAQGTSDGVSPGEALKPGDGPAKGGPDRFEPVVREILERLPVRGPTDKTRGIWVDAEGHEHELVSGVDEYSADVDRFMEEQRIRIAPGADTLGSHVEVKFAMRMRREGLTDATIIINNKPCPGPYGCHRNLWKFLPEGGRLTVYGPDNFKRTYPE